MAIMVVKGITLAGMPQILSVEVVEEETEENYPALFASLKIRGLKKVWLCVSDTHKGLQAAIQKEFPGASWQRCKVYFMRNILARVSQKDKVAFGQKLKAIWDSLQFYAFGELDARKISSTNSIERLNAEIRRR